MRLWDHRGIFLFGENKMAKGFDALILAWGSGERMRSKRPPVLHPLGGLPLIHWVLETALSLGPDRVVVLTDRSEVGEALSGQPVITVQGTWSSGREGFLSVRGGLQAPRFLVVPGDLPLVPKEALEGLLEHHLRAGSLISLLSYVPRGSEGGHLWVIRDEGGRPREVRPGASPSAEACSGVYLLENAPEVWETLGSVPQEESPDELLGKLVAALHPRTASLTWPGGRELRRIGDRWDLSQAEAWLRERTARRLALEGVTVVDPLHTYIGPKVKVGEDTTILPGSHLLGETRVGSDCLIGPDAYLADTEVASGARIWYSVLEGAWVGEGARIGPYAHLRPGARIGRGARIGNFVEIKNAELGEGVRAGHLAYIGDAEVGPGTNIGAGTITCNYDGVKKHRTVIGKWAFIGSNTALVAPVTVGEGAVVGAGSVITEDVPPYALALGRARQVIKPDWARKRRGGDQT